MNPLESLESTAIGAMNRGDGSLGSRLQGVASASVRAPGFWAQLFVILMARLTYSCSWLHPLFGSAAPSPPSPPKLEPIPVSAFVPSALTPERLDTPLSCRPPETTTPPCLASLPTETE